MSCQEGARRLPEEPKLRSIAMSKSYTFESDCGTVTITECGDYRKSSPFDPDMHDYSVECGGFYADIYEIDDPNDIVDELEEAGITVDRKAVCKAIEG